MEAQTEALKKAVEYQERFNAYRTVDAEFSAIKRILRDIFGHVILNPLTLTKDRLNGLEAYHKNNRRFHPDSEPFIVELFGLFKSFLDGAALDISVANKLVQKIVWAGKDGYASAPVIEEIEANATKKGKDAFLDNIWKDWQEKNPQLSDKAISDYGLAIKHFHAACGIVPIGSIDQEHVVKMKDYLLQNRETLGMSSSTINKHTQNLKNLFSYAHKNLYVKNNPLRGFSVVVDLKDAIEVEPYSAEELKRLVGTVEFRAFRQSWPECYWMALISLLSGMRMDEIGQLKHSNIHECDEGHYFDLRHGIKLKTKSSKRVVPVHAELVELGLLQYIAGIAPEGEDYIFPQLKPYRGRRTHYFSKDFGRYKAKLGFPARVKDFHSFRHTFKDLCRDAGLTEEEHDALTGHSGKTVGRDYGSSYSIKARFGLMSRVQCPINIALLGA